MNAIRMSADSLIVFWDGIREKTLFRREKWGGFELLSRFLKRKMIVWLHFFDVKHLLASWKVKVVCQIIIPKIRKLLLVFATDESNCAILLAKKRWDESLS